MKIRDRKDERLVVNRHRFYRIISQCTLVSAVLATGCLPSLVMDLSPERRGDESSGPAVAIEAVVDGRQFTESRGSHELPSLDPEGRSDPGYRSRAIGRHNNGSEVLLPVGRSVEDVAREAVAEAFRREGYRLVASGEPSALPVRVEIDRFWGWTSGALVIYYHFDASLRLDVETPDGPRRVEAARDFRLGSWGSNVNFRWKSTMARGLNELIEALRSDIRNQLGNRSASIVSAPGRARRP